MPINLQILVFQVKNKPQVRIHHDEQQVYLLILITIHISLDSSPGSSLEVLEQRLVIELSFPAVFCIKLVI